MMMMMISSPKWKMKYVQSNTSATTPDPQIKTTETHDNAQTVDDSKLRHYPEGKENLLNT